MEALKAEKAEAEKEMAQVESEVSIDPEKFVDFKRISARVNELSVEIVKLESEIKIQEAVEAAKKEILENAEVEEVYEVPEGEEHLVHARLETEVKYSPITGEKIAKSYIQKFSVKEFIQFEKSARAIGYDYKVLHKPE